MIEVPRDCFGIMRVISICTSSGAESTLKVGVYFNIFPNLLPISESGGITKSRPIDPFFDVIYLFLNVRFEQKVFEFTVFGCHHLRFVCIIWYFLPSTQSFFHSISLNFFDDLFFLFFLLNPPFFLHLLPKKFFFYTLKVKIFIRPPKNFFASYILLNPPPPNFYCAPSLTPIFIALQKVGVLTPEIPPLRHPCVRQTSAFLDF